MKLNDNIRGKILTVVLGRIEIARTSGKTIDEKLVLRLIDMELLYSNFDADDEDKKLLLRDVSYNTRITHSHGAHIVDNYKEVRDWFSHLDSDSQNGEFWKRYKRYLEKNNSLDPSSIATLENKTLPDLMNCLGDPNLQSHKRIGRRGLVIGDVQSGKTATYTGLICKAADAGYKVVILLAGITESLRQQTQERIDEGIIGITASIVVRGGKTEIVHDVVGVGNSHDGKYATPYTSCLNDFKKDVVETISATLKSHNSLVIFVVKKNAGILDNLYSWLVDLNKDVLDDTIHAPLLLIDDEADNASINTNKPDLDPTRINGLIRKIWGAFNNSTYIGFTATPFANVFIEPETPDEMFKEDLFPENFIYVLPTPSSYIGAEKLFGYNASLSECLKYITDIIEPTSEELKDDENPTIRPLYYKHSKDWHGSLPNSLKDAIRCFYLANVIRDLRLDDEKPRTMMINVSRFVRVHGYIREWVKSLYDQDFINIRTDFDSKFSNNKGLPLWEDLHRLYNMHFEKCGFTEQQVLNKSALIDAIESIEVIAVNSKSGKLDYKKNPSLRCIAIGGLSLSRGLTLSGLSTSYFYRNTATFDVLMQMGRWFGYRPHYGDICQVWTSQESADYYRMISEATEELKSDIKQMYDDRLTPKDFGIKVLDVSRDLNITSPNKMRRSFDKVEFFSFWGNHFETPYVNLNIQNNDINLKCVQDLVKEINGDESGIKVFAPKESSSLMFSKVPFEYVRNFIKLSRVSLKNVRFYHKEMCEFLELEDDPKIKEWDVVIFSGDCKEDPYVLPGGYSIKMMTRKLVFMQSNHIGFTGSAGRLGSKTDGSVPFKIELGKSSEYKAICKKVLDDHNDRNDKHYKKSDDLPARSWFELISDRRPCLMIYLVRPKNSSDQDERMNEYLKQLGRKPLVGIGVGYPANGILGAVTKKYKVNKIYYKQMLEESGEEDMEDE